MSEISDSLDVCVETQEGFIYGDEPVDTTHRVITTSMDGDTIESRVQRAQVVILLEIHDDQENKRLNGQVVQLYYKPGDLVLFERSTVPEYLPFPVKRNAQSWDLKVSEELVSLYPRWNTVIFNVAHVLLTHLTLAITSKDEPLSEVEPDLVIPNK